MEAKVTKGADHVIVPAMSRDDDPAALARLRQQAEKGAVIVSICPGTKVLAAAGLLDGKRATTHWYCPGEAARYGTRTAHVVAISLNIPDRAR